VQPKIATTLGTPPPSPAVHWKLVKQWPYDKLGSSSCSSVVATDADGRKYLIDLVPFFNCLADLQANRATKTDDSDFWEDFQTHLDMPDIHTPNLSSVKKALNAKWLKISGKPFPRHPSDAADGDVEVC
jgi:hypothetical protein